MSPSGLVIEGLHAEVAGREILRGIDLQVRSGEVHAVMGPNGSGKSTLAHVLLGRPGYRVTRGRVALDGVDLLALPTWERAQAGLFLGMQYPIEVPGVSLADVLTESLRAGGRDPGEVPALVGAEADTGRLRSPGSWPARSTSTSPAVSANATRRYSWGCCDPASPFSTRSTPASMWMPSGPWPAGSRRRPPRCGLGVLAITHYTRLLTVLRPDHTHVLFQGRIVRSGGPELADELERTGYAGWTTEPDGGAATPTVDPFADPLA